MKGLFAKKSTEPKKILKQFRDENNSEYKEKVLQNEQFAREINIDATPSFLIFSENEVYRIIGAQPFERFEQVFEELGST